MGTGNSRGKIISEKENKELLMKRDSMCNIISSKKDKIKGIGFFLYINNKDIPFNTCLMTNYHIFGKNDIIIDNRIYIHHQNKLKYIELHQNRKLLYDELLNYICIEILKNDNISQYFEIDKNLNNLIYSYNKNDIILFPYQHCNYFSLTRGQILDIRDNKIYHIPVTTGSLSGSPILSRNYLSVIGLFSGVYNNQYNISITINSILNDIIKKCNSKNTKNNIIIAELTIKEEDINKNIRIINSYEEYIRKENNKNGEYIIKYENKYGNEKEIKDKCKIEINGEIMPFYYYCSFKEKGKYLIKYLFSKNLTKTNYMFCECECMSNIDLSNFDTQKVTDMSWMFSDCKSLTNINLSNLNTQNVTDMSGMFWGCNSLKTINLSNFNTQSVKNMSWLFCECNSLIAVDLSKFRTQNVTNISGMFSGCHSITNLYLSNFKTQNVTDMSWLFCECLSLTDIDLSNFITENVIDMSYMFSGCESLTNVNLSKFNTKNVTNMSSMFYECKSLKNIDLSHFDTQNVSNMTWLFSCCESLTRISLLNFNTQIFTDMNEIFDGCDNLKIENIKTRDNKIIEKFKSYKSISNNNLRKSLPNKNTNHLKKTLGYNNYHFDYPNYYNNEFGLKNTNNINYNNFNNNNRDKNTFINQAHNIIHGYNMNNYNFTNQPNYIFETNNTHNSFSNNPKFNHNMIFGSNKRGFGFK